MNFICLDGKQVKIAIIPSRNLIGKVFRSNLQSLVGEKLIEKYPQEQILEDFCLPRSKNLSLDFFIPRRRIAIEVNPIKSGHTEYSSFFHGQITSGKFGKQKSRDMNKARFCEINNIDFFVITSEKDLYDWLI